MNQKVTDISETLQAMAEEMRGFLSRLLTKNVCAEFFILRRKIVESGLLRCEKFAVKLWLRLRYDATAAVL